MRAVADDLLDAAGRRPVRDLVDPADIAAVVTRSLATVPPSDAIAAIVEMAVDVALDTPRTPYPLGDVVPRERVEALLDALLAQTPALERTLDRLTATPLVGVMATRFLARVATEVLETNRSVADKVLPGLGSLMSFGTTAASRVVGAADSQLQGLLGDTVGKGGNFAVGRLNKVAAGDPARPHHPRGRAAGVGPGRRAAARWARRAGRPRRGRSPWSTPAAA